MYTRFLCSCLSLCIVCKYVCLCSSMFVCSYMYFLLSRFLYVNPISFSTLQRQNLPPGKPHSSLAFSSTAAMEGQCFFQDLGQGGAKRQYVIWWGGMALSTCTARGGESEPRGGKCSPPPPPERNPEGYSLLM